MAVVAYCVKCKAKKEMVDPQEGVTKNGRVITKGTCPDCGTKMSLIGGVAKKQLFQAHYQKRNSARIAPTYFSCIYLMCFIGPAQCGTFSFYKPA